MERLTVESNPNRKLVGFEVLPSLGRGDQLVFLVTPIGRTTMYYNGEELESTDDPNLGAALFRVWLDPATSYQHIRKGMLHG
jgi:Chalcone isomerase-like